MKRSKQIQRNGSLSIPADIRRNSGLFAPGSAVDITSEDGKLVIAPHTPCCIHCGSTEKVLKFKDRFVCGSCVEDLNDLILSQAMDPLKPSEQLEA